MTRARVARLVLLVVGLGGCGAGASTRPVVVTALPEHGQLRREVVRSRRGETDVVRIEGELAEGGELRVLRAAHEQGGQTVRALPDDAGVRVAQRARPGRGAPMPEVGPELAFALGAELATAVALAPFGASGLDHDAEGDTVLSLGVPADSVLPREVPVRCARTGPHALRCEGALDRPVTVDPAAAAQGVRAELRGAVVLTVEAVAAVPQRCELTITFDVVSRLGEFEEHDAGTLRSTTELAPSR